jgi:hypothetical protein
MGYPESYSLFLPDTNAYRLIGNSVAIPVVKAIFERILATGVLQRRLPSPDDDACSALVNEVLRLEEEYYSKRPAVIKSLLAELKEIETSLRLLGCDHS